jgi:acetyl-CoA acyltransferase
LSAAAIVGIGLTPFGRFKDRSLSELAGQAIADAIADAGITPGDIGMAFVANSMAAVTTGQVAVVGQSVLRPLGYSGIPVYNIDNACAASSSALDLAVHAVESGRADVVVVVGVEKLYGAEKSVSFRALNGAVNTEYLAAAEIRVDAESVFVARIYPQRLDQYRATFGLSAQTLAEIAVKNRLHATRNPRAQFSKLLSVDEVLSARVIVDPLTVPMCAPISDGASAVIVVSRRRAESAQFRPIWVRGIAVGMGGASGHESLVSRTAHRAFREAEIAPGDIGIAEVHDSIAFNELLAYEELGLCGPGEGAEFVLSGRSRLGGEVPVNTSGGLESRGHPVAATGLAQIFELVEQLRHEAGDRQVQDARIAVAENAGGYVVDDTAAAVVTVLSAERPR